MISLDSSRIKSNGEGRGVVEGGTVATGPQERQDKNIGPSEASKTEENRRKATGNYKITLKSLEQRAYPSLRTMFLI